MPPASVTRESFVPEAVIRGTILVILAMLVATGSTVVWSGAAGERAIIEDLREIGGDIIIIKPSPDFAEAREVAQQVSSHPGVVRSQPFLIEPVTLVSGRGRVEGLLKGSPAVLSHSGEAGPPAPRVIVGTGLLTRLGIVPGDQVALEPPQWLKGGAASSVECVVSATRQFRLHFSDDNLALADFDELVRLGYKPTGVDLWLDDVDASGGVAESLREKLGAGYQVLTLFDLHRNALGPLLIRRRLSQGVLSVAVFVSVAVSLILLRRRRRSGAQAGPVMPVFAVLSAWLFGSAITLFVGLLNGTEIVDRSHTAYATLAPSAFAAVVGAMAATAAIAVLRHRASRSR